MFSRRNPSHTSDESLPEDTRDAFAAANGDKMAFERLVRKYEKFVCTTVFAVVRNREDSFDVSQEVFLKLYHSIGSFKGDSSFSSWLYRIAKNCALDHLRRQKRHHIFSLDTEDEDGNRFILQLPDTSSAGDPEHRLLQSERKDMLYQALGELGDEHREILFLRDIEGLTYDQIGERLQLESGTVKSRLFRAREALRKKLEEKKYF